MRHFSDVFVFSLRIKYWQYGMIASSGKGRDGSEHYQVVVLMTWYQPWVFTVLDRSRGPGSRSFQNLAGRVGSRQEVFEIPRFRSGRVRRCSISRVGSGWVGSGPGVLEISWVESGRVMEVFEISRFESGRVSLTGRTGTGRIGR